MYKKLIFRYWAVLCILLETFVVIQGYMNVPDFAVLLSIVAVGFFFYPRAFFNLPTLFFILFVSLMLIVIQIKSYDVQFFRVIFIYWLFSLSLINVFLYNKDWKGLKIVLIVGMLILFISTIFSIIYSGSQPDLVRQYVLYSSEQDEAGVKLGQRLGIANYGMIHGIPTLLPLFVYLFKKEKTLFLKILWLLLIAIFYYLIIVSGFGTALILSTLILIASVLVSDNKRKNLLLFGILILIGILFINKEFIINSLDWVKGYFVDSAIYDKIVDIQYSIQTNDFEGQLNTRGNLYADSWNTFYKYPIIGSPYQSDAGGHLFIADFLAWFGIVGTLPLILFFYYSFRRIYLIIENHQKIYYVLALLPFIILSFVKAVPFFEQVLYLLVFIPAVFLLKKDTVKDIS